ncbi:unnamed protein product [marine sediment metagenome]|uniref:Nudix hydrolase domain-containing protein n=1 Tax=marine sediment metagenome TaxID=412755 RepID=X1KEG0_9ZZZZ
MVQGSYRPIATIYPSPGVTSERIYLFLSLVNYKDRINTGGGLPSEGEDIQVESLSFQESMMMIARGEISDAKTIIALQHLALLKSRGMIRERLRSNKAAPRTYAILSRRAINTAE